MAAGMAAAAPGPVLELRQYKLVAGERDRFVELFEREFIETQEAEGMELVGQFRDRTDRDRFTWIRTFPDMDSRKHALTAFYSGPTWLAHRNAANGMMIDSDNVLLLRPAWPGSGFASMPARPTNGNAASARLTVVTIHYLWQRPEKGFTAFFKDRFAPALDRAGIRVEAALVREESANNFRLPVREGEKLFIWMARAKSEAAWKAGLARLVQDPEWTTIGPRLLNLEERPAQRLLLDPTPRSKFR
jgi:hypothetical protein